MWQLRHAVTADDATYLALAEALSDSPGTLLTTDARFASAIAASREVEALLVG